MRNRAAPAHSSGVVCHAGELERGDGVRAEREGECPQADGVGKAAVSEVADEQHGGDRQPPDTEAPCRGRDVGRVGGEIATRGSASGYGQVQARIGRHCRRGSRGPRASQLPPAVRIGRRERLVSHPAPNRGGRRRAALEAPIRRAASPIGCSQTFALTVALQHRAQRRAYRPHPQQHKCRALLQTRPHPAVRQTRASPPRRPVGPPDRQPGRPAFHRRRVRATDFRHDRSMASL